LEEASSTVVSSAFSEDLGEQAKTEMQIRPIDQRVDSFFIG
jgi:hypothetical protein